MLFSVKIDLSRGLTLSTEEEARLRAEEADAARLLAKRGVLVRLWRRQDVAWGNLGLWHATDRDELLEELRRLPLYPWMDIEVEGLAPHPSDPARNRDEPG